MLIKVGSKGGHIELAALQLSLEATHHSLVIYGRFLTSRHYLPDAELLNFLLANNVLLNLAPPLHALSDVWTPATSLLSLAWSKIAFICLQADMSYSQGLTCSKKTDVPWQQLTIK